MARGDQAPCRSPCMLPGVGRHQVARYTARDAARFLGQPMRFVSVPTRLCTPV